MEQKEILKLALTAANSLYNSILENYNTEFEEVLQLAEHLSQEIISQQKSNDSFMVFDTLSKYQTEYRQRLEDKIEQISNEEEPKVFWTESLHTFEKSISQVPYFYNIC